MKNIALFFLISGLLINSIFSQSELTENDKLFITGKVWGFLKYYHPNVAQGDFNWDEQLFYILPKIEKAKTQKQLSKIYLDWISSLGKVSKCRRCNNLKEVFFDKNFNLSWIQNPEYFDKNLSNTLNFIKNNRAQGENHFLIKEKVGQIKVVNEPEYKSFDYSNEHHKLLILFKFWNIIEYFYPYKYLTDQKWDAVLIEMIPKFRMASNKTYYRRAVRELVAKLDDTHAVVVFDDIVRNYLPLKVKNINNKAVVSGYYNDSIGKSDGFKLGDIILKVNGLEMESEVFNTLKYANGSNANIKRTNAYYNILHGEDSIVNLTIVRNNDTLHIEAKRYRFKEFHYGNRSSGKKWKSINDYVGYINMAYVNRDDVSEIMNGLMDKKAIIIDLRNYPSFIYWILSRYLNKEKRDFAKSYVPVISYPGRFIFHKNSQTGVKNKNAYQGKVIILVDQETISRSEFTAMAFQTADNVTTIGSQTAGADGNVVAVELADGIKTYFTGVGIYYPDGTESQRKGVKIDIAVEPTIKGLRNGQDEILERAIELANNQK